MFAVPRTFQRTVYRPGEICQFDLWEPAAEVPVGHGQTRRDWVVVACLDYSRAGVGTLVFSKEVPDLLAGIRRCLWQLGGLAKTFGPHPGGASTPLGAWVRRMDDESRRSDESVRRALEHRSLDRRRSSGRAA